MTPCGTTPSENAPCGATRTHSNGPETTRFTRAGHRGLPVPRPVRHFSVTIHHIPVSNGPGVRGFPGKHRIFSDHANLDRYSSISGRHGHVPVDARNEEVFPGRKALRVRFAHAEAGFSCFRALGGCAFQGAVVFVCLKKKYNCLPCPRQQ